MKKIILSFLIFGTTSTFAQGAINTTFTNTALPGQIFNTPSSFQDIYKGIYEYERNPINELDIANNVSQRFIETSRFSSDVGNQKNIFPGEKVTIGNILNTNEIIELCNLGILGSSSNEERISGFSFLELLTVNDQLQISGIIQNYCQEEEKNLQLERNLWFDLSKEGVFNNARTDDAPFDLLAVAADIDTIFHGIIYTGTGATGIETSGGFNSQAPNISWAYSDRAFNENTGLPFFFDPLASPNDGPIPSDNESIQFSPAIPPAFLAQKNPFEPHQDTREMTQYVCPPLSPNCEDGITPYYETENTPITQDISWMGVLGKIKEQVSIMNDASLYGGISTSSFAELALPEMLRSNQFISHDPSHMVYEYIPSKSKDEQSNKLLEASLKDVLQPYDVLLAQKIRETPCGQYTSVSNTTADALENISSCRERRNTDLKNVLFYMKQLYTQKMLQQGIAQNIANAEQLGRELESFQAEVDFLESILERLNNKKRTS